MSVVLSLGPYLLANNDLKVSTSIKPLHSLASAVMEGVAEPSLIIPGNVSPHDHVMRPSDMRTLQNSSIIFFIGEPLEASLGHASKSLKDKVNVVEMMRIEGLDLVKWVGDQHHHHHDEIAEQHDTAADLLGYDHHIWLDPKNAIAMTREIARQLSVLDSDNAKVYAANADQMIQEIEDMLARLQTIFKSVPDTSFIVYHDGFRSFEHRFGLDGQSLAFMEGEQTPGARRLQEIHGHIKEDGIQCVFTEPQFDTKFIEAMNAANLKVEELDPLGGNIAAGPDLYMELIQTLATTIHRCLTESEEESPITE